MKASLTDEGFLAGLHVLPPPGLYPRLSDSVPPLHVPPLFLPLMAVMSGSHRSVTHLRLLLRSAPQQLQDLPGAQKQTKAGVWLRPSEQESHRRANQFPWLGQDRK